MPSEEIDESSFGFALKNECCTEERISIYRPEDTIEKGTESPSETWVNRYRADIVRIDAITGESQILADDLYPLGMIISPNGKLLVFANAVGHESPGIQQMTYDFWVVSIEPTFSEKPRCIARGVYLQGSTFTWHDDRTILYTTAGPLADGGLWAVHTEGKSAPYRVAFSEKVAFQREFDPPMILANGDALIVAERRLWRIIHETGEMVNVVQGWDRHITAVLSMDRFIMYQQDGQFIIIQTNEPKEMLNGFYRLNLSSGEIEFLFEEPRKHYPWYFGGTAFCRIDHKDKLIYLAESDNEPPTLYMLDIDSKIVTKIGDLNTDRYIP